jgi:poly-gamma-glutamate capsule biosynthesis protein CapA/YwtB (metallophosphatase superfamily)
MLHRAVAAAGVVLVLAGPTVILFNAMGASGAATVPVRPAPIAVRSQLPAWRAPGAPIVVVGSAGANEPVQLVVDGAVAARTTADRLGRFRLAVRLDRPGKPLLSLRSPGHTRRLGVVPVRPLTLAAVGDITFGEQVGPAVERYGGAYPWTQVASLLRSADLTTGNLETAVGTSGSPAAKEYTFQGPPQALPPMSSIAGFDLLTLANNHAVDYGREALLETIRNVRAAHIVPFGAGATDRAARRAAIVSAGGLRVAFLGYSDVNPDGFIATATEPGTAEADVDAIAADVRAARRRADVVVCFFHWGVELHADPDARQRQFASACLNAGARVVLGAHPHVLGRVDRPSAHALVAWTLGNFVFPSSREPARTAILRVRLDSNGVRGYDLVPVTIDGFRPVPASVAARARPST